MPIYNIYNRSIWEGHYGVRAASAQEACEQIGWQIGDCYVKEVPELPRKEHPTCEGCEYQKLCKKDPQKEDYCPIPGRKVGR